jgi:hypothetical protein
MSAMSLKAVRFPACSRRGWRANGGRRGRRGSAVEVLAHDAIEVKNVVRAAKALLEELA